MNNDDIEVIEAELVEPLTELTGDESIIITRENVNAMYLDVYKRAPKPQDQLRAIDGLVKVNGLTKDKAEQSVIPKNETEIAALTEEQLVALINSGDGISGGEGKRPVLLDPSMYARQDDGDVHNALPTALDGGQSMQDKTFQDTQRQDMKLMYDEDDIPDNVRSIN